MCVSVCVLFFSNSQYKDSAKATTKNEVKGLKSININIVSGSQFAALNAVFWRHPAVRRWHCSRSALPVLKSSRKFDRWMRNHLRPLHRKPSGHSG